MLISRTLVALTILTLTLAPRPATAEDAADPKNQILVFGGISVLDASREQTHTWALPFPGGRGPFDLPFRPGRGFDVDLRTKTSLGNSPLLGVRYSRYIKGRLAVEADLAVGPGHDLETSGDVCVAERCFGSGILPGLPGPRPPGVDLLPRAAARRVTAWHYGAGLTYDITGGDVRPVLVFGAGGASWSGSGRAETDFELRFGAGLKILFGKVGARVDVIDHLVLDHFLSGKSEHDIQVTAGLLVGF
jgi:hypothetical protein